MRRHAMPWHRNLMIRASLCYDVAVQRHYLKSTCDDFASKCYALSSHFHLFALECDDVGFMCYDLASRCHG